MYIYTRIHTKHSQMDGKREVQNIRAPLLTNGRREGPSFMAPSQSMSNGRRDGSRERPSLVAPSPSLTNGRMEGSSLLALSPSLTYGRRVGAKYTLSSSTVTFSHCSYFSPRTCHTHKFVCSTTKPQRASVKNKLNTPSGESGMATVGPTA